MPTPRLLLFGTPNAGKTSLLGALAQAAATQASLLKGQLIDAAGAWEQLQKNTYSAKPTSIAEAAAYDLHLQPSEDGAAPAEASVLDCSGASAQEMLQSEQPFLDSHPLKKPILAADTVVVAVDASLSGKQLGAEFEQVTRWLVDLQKLRGKRTDIGELPVYLVLTKCDLLARKDDTFSKWMQRIEEGKRRVSAKFREALKEQGAGFGTIQLQLWATAIKRPALADRPAKPQEPLGVAELFRQCLQSAADFQERRRTSQGRLQNVLVGALGLVAILGLVVALMFEFQPGVRLTSLDEKVQPLLPKNDAKPAERLLGSLKKLDEKNKALAAIESDDEFKHLPSATREAVTKYHAELTQYLQTSQDAQVMLKLPYLAKNQDEFKEMEKSAASFALPPEHFQEWDDTRLGKQIRKVRQEYAALHTALKAEEVWMRGQIDADTMLLKQGTQIYSKLLNGEKLAPQDVENWQRQFRTHMNPKFATPREEAVRGVSRLTYEELAKFEQVQKAQKDWDVSKRKLKKMADSIQDEMR